MTPPNPALHLEPVPATGASARSTGGPAGSPSRRRTTGARRAAELPVRTPPAARDHIRPLLAFDHLGERRVEVAFEVHGGSAAGPAPTTHRPAPRDGTATTALPTLVLGGISAGRHLAPAAFDAGPGWWAGVVGRGLVLDPARGPLIGVDYLGGTDRSGEPVRPVTTHDQARAIAAVLDHLGMRRASFVGASYGGMVALAFAELFPHRVGRLVVLGAAHRTHPMATAVRSVQRAAVKLGVDSGDPARGLSLARALAMTTYRSTREFEERFSPFALSAGAPDVPARFPVESYLEARGADFTRRFDAARFLALSESIDLHATAPANLPARALLVSFDTDVLTPPWLVDELAAREAGANGGRSRARHVTIPSLYGHDAFLKETGAVSRCLRSELDAPGTPALPASFHTHREEAGR